MASDFREVRAAIKETLQQAVKGLTVYRYPQLSVKRTPALILTADGVDYDPAFQSDDMDMTLRGYLLVAGLNEAAFVRVDEMLQSTGDKSIRAALRTDQTLGGEVHYCILTRSENYGIRQIAGQDYVSADLIFETSRKPE